MNSNNQFKHNPLPNPLDIMACDEFFLALESEEIEF